MPKAVPRRRAPGGGRLDETSVPYTMFALRCVRTQLQYLADHACTGRAMAQFLLTQAHIDEAVGLLAAVTPNPGAADVDCNNDGKSEPMPLMHTWPSTALAQTDRYENQSRTSVLCRTNWGMTTDVPAKPTPKAP